MFRLRSMLTRAAMIALFVATIWIARDPIVRSWLIKSGESVTGAKVEIGLVRTSLSDNRLSVRHLAIADPRDPMRNLIQAESCSLTINWDDLLHRRFVVEDGTTSRLVFGAPRSRTGAKGNVDEAPATVPVQPRVVASDAGRNLRAQWLDQFQYAAPILDAENTELMRVAQQIFDRWTSRLEQELVRIESLKTRIDQAPRLLDFNSNLLRNQGRIEMARQKIDAMQAEIKAFAIELLELDRRIVEDQNALAQAQRMDGENIAANTARHRIDGQLITRLLLNGDQVRQAEEILAWFNEFRKSVPNPREDFRPDPAHDNNVRFAGSTAPDFLIKQLQLEGEGRVGGVKFNFSGVAKNISTQPERLNEPVQFNLRAQGNTHALVSCTLDRTDGNRNDSISINCVDLLLPARTLGDEASLSIAVSPCRANVAVELVCVDERVSGKFDFEHSNLVMQIESLDPLVGGAEVTDRINLELASISDYQVQATLSGPLHQPQIEFQSNLGDRLAEKFNQVVERRSHLAASQSQGLLDRQLAKLRNEVAAKVTQLRDVLEQDIQGREAALIADLNSRLPEDPLNRSIQR